MPKRFRDRSMSMDTERLSGEVSDIVLGQYRLVLIQRWPIELVPIVHSRPTAKVK
jgi:hypothetical protein